MPLRGQGGVQRSSGAGVRLLAQCMPGHRTESQPASPASANLKRKTKATSMVHPKPSWPLLCGTASTGVWGAAGGTGVPPRLSSNAPEQGAGDLRVTPTASKCTSWWQSTNSLSQRAPLGSCSAQSLLLIFRFPAPSSPQMPLSGSLSPLLLVLNLPEDLHMKTSQMKMKMTPNFCIFRGKNPTVFWNRNN